MSISVLRKRGRSSVVGVFCIFLVVGLFLQMQKLGGQEVVYRLRMPDFNLNPPGENSNIAPFLNASDHLVDMEGYTRSYHFVSVDESALIPENIPTGFPETSRVETPALNSANLLIEAVVMIESSGKPGVVGSAGEHGLMQIMPATWEETTRKMFGKAIPFKRAFEPELNQQVGAYYLGEIQGRLAPYQAEWNADLRSLTLASYNAGFTAVLQADFDVARLPRSVQSYVKRASALHDAFLDDAQQERLTMLTN